MPNEVRAARACHRCNQRRVKCDASHIGLPCSRCQKHRLSDCHLMPSRRGTYVRKRHLQNQNIVSPAVEDGTGLGASQFAQQEAVRGQNWGDAIERMPNSEAESSRRQESNTPLDDGEPEQGPVNSSASSDRDRRVAEVSTGDGLVADEQHEMSWPAVFDYFLESRTDRQEILDKASITYLGDSFPLAIVLDDLREGGRLRVHHPWPNASHSDEPKEAHPPHMLSEDVAFLESKGAFKVPNKSLMDSLVLTFVDSVYPVYPIVTRKEFLQQYDANKIPWILLHAVCFIGTTYCPLAVIHSAGFSSRKQARSTFYKKTKVLFDLGYEKNKITVLQSVILLTFWVGKPTDFWTSFTWIGIAVTIAETLGIHRSTASTNMPTKDKSLLKRLWWVLVVRDAFCAALFGRTMRIDTSQSDVEMLCVEDFENYSEPNNQPVSEVTSRSSLYNIEASKLALLLRDSIRYRSEAASVESHTTCSRLHEKLQQWKSTVPPSLNWQNYPIGSNLFASALSMLYDHQLIFLHLQKPDYQNPGNGGPSFYTAASSDGMFASNITHAAAQRIASLACTLVTKNILTKSPHEIFSAIFSAETAFYTQSRHPNPAIAQLARAQLTLCQMSMHEAREFWDSAPWVMQLFNNLTSKMDKEDIAADSTVTPTSSSIEVLPNAAGLIGSNLDFIPSDMFYDAWPGHPMLSSFLELSNDPNAFYNIMELSPSMSNPTSYQEAQHY